MKDLVTTLCFCCFFLLLACSQEQAASDTPDTADTPVEANTAAPPAAPSLPVGTTETDTSEAAPETPAEPKKFYMAADQLNSRYQSYLETLNAMKGTDSAMNMAYSKSMDVLQGGGTVALISQAYEELLAAVETTQREDDTGYFKTVQQEIVQPATSHFLDRVLLDQPQQLNAERTQMLKKMVGKLKRLGLNTKDLAANWNGEALTETMTANTATEITAIFK